MLKSLLNDGLASILTQQIYPQNHFVPVHAGMTQTTMPEDAPRLDKVFTAPDTI